MENLSVLRSKDVISLEVDSLGILAIPSAHEPLAEHDEPISHLRVCPPSSITEADLTRCMFRIETDAGQRAEIRFGSVVKLTHVPSELVLVASEDEDFGYMSESNEAIPRNVYLRKSLGGMGELAHKWIITPRYKLRGEADPVRNNDFIILKNAQYKNLALTSFQVDSESYPDHLVGLQSTEALFNKTGMKIVCLTSSRDERKPVEKIEAGDNAPVVEFVRGGDYVRLLHRENKAHVMCRVDDESELLSTITPLGSVCRKRMDEKDRVHAIIARSLVMQQPRMQYDFPVAYSPLGIWQIIPVDPVSNYRMFHRIQYGSPVRLRHLISGQYLAIRPVRKTDSKLIKKHVYVHEAEDNADVKHAGMHPSGTADSKPVAAKTTDKPQQPLSQVGRRVDDSDDDNGSDSVEGGHRRGSDESDDGDLGRGGNAGEATYTLTISSANATKIKNSSWLGKNHSYLVFTFGDQFSQKTDQFDGKNVASWQLDSRSDDFTMRITYEDLLNVPLKVDLMNSNTILHDSVVGHGELLLKDVIVAADHSVLEFNVDLKDKRHNFAGTLSLVISITHDSKSKLARPNFGNFTGIKQSFKGPLAAEEHISHEPEIVLKAQGSKWAVATSSEPSKYTLFSISALNPVEDDSGEGDFIALDENVILESAVTSLRLHLADVPKALESGDSGWWEYTMDKSFVPLAYIPSVIIDSDVFHIQKVAQEEVQDTIYAMRLLPLARAATSTLQLTPSHDMLFEPLFRHFQVALYSFLLWVIGQADCDGCLLPCDLPIPQLLVDSSTRERDDSDDDDDDDEGDDAQDDEEYDDAHDDDENRERRSAEKYGNERDDGVKGNGSGISQSGDKPYDGSDPGLITSASAQGPPKNDQFSSLAPWIGRMVGKEDRSAYKQTDLERHAVNCMAEFYARNIPLNAKMIRRQGILFDLMLMEQLAQFLNVYFILQRALQFTQDNDLRNAYGALPSFLDHSCTAILKLLHACVYKNERNALKMISIQGMFLSLVSQRILGWDAPIESIMEICRDYYSSAATHPGQLSVEAVLTRSIHSSDIRQILEQMSWMHMNNHESAENILKLLTLLCRSGKAADHFQNILANLLITCNPSSLELGSAGKEFTERMCSSMLFSTAYLNGRWHVKFKPLYILPSEEERSLSQLSQEHHKEAEYLKMLFNVYNSDESNDDILDLEECFCLLEDLGFGGPFVYEEMGHLLGVNIWGFLNWWCTRAPFYFLSTSVSHSQISPYQAMELMGIPIRPSDLTAELRRTSIPRESIMETLQFWSIISSRIPGYELKAFEDDEEGEEEDTFIPRMANFRPGVGQQESHGPHTGLMALPKKPTKLILRQPQAQDWICFDLALTPAWPDHIWLRNSLILLESICSGGNILCQRIVSNLLPPECLLDLINIQSINVHDRHIICDLLVSVYVEVDFIFPTRSLPAIRGTQFCGYMESLYNPPISIGKIFNPVCRVRFSGPGSMTGNDLRTKLFQFLKANMSRIRLSFNPVKGQMLYTNSLLRLFHALLSRGFFNEEEFHFFQSLPVRANNPLRPKERIPLDEVFCIDNVEEFFISKLNESLDALRESEALAEVANSTVDTARIVSKKKMPTRKTFNGFEKIVRKINSEFEDGSYNAIIDNTISILFCIHGMKQMMRIQKLWNHSMEHAHRCSLDAYSTNFENMLTAVNTLMLTKPIQTLFVENMDEEEITRALFCGTLHVDAQLRQRCYDLLNRRLSLPLEISELLKSVKLERHPHHAFIKRLLMVYISLALKHVEDAMSSLRNYRDYTIHVLHFVLENITGLLLNKVLDRISNDAISHEASNRFKEDRDKVIGYYLTSSDIPCPGGDDDFFLLDVKKVKENESEKVFLMQRYSSASRLDSLQNFKWVIDATSEMLDFVRRVSPTMVARYNHLGRPSWLSLSSEDQNAYNRIFVFLSTISRENRAVRDAVLPLIESLLHHFYPYSSGAVELVHLLLSYSQDNRLEMTLINALKMRIASLGDDDQIERCKIRLFSAMLLNPSDSVYFAGVGCVQEELIKVIRTKVHELEEGGDSHEALAVVRMLARVVTRKHLLPRDVVSLFQVACPRETLTVLLTSDTLSLELKTELTCVATFLYEADELAVERMMLSELRAMRISMYLLNEMGRLNESNLIFHYVTQGVIPTLKHRVLECNVVGAFMVNEYVMGEARTLQAKLINKQAAQYAVDYVSRKFPTLFELPDSKPSTSFVPTECVNCLTVLLNVLAFEDAYLYRQLDDDQVADLIWVTGAVSFILLSRSDYVFDHTLDSSIDIAQYGQVIRGLHEVLQGLILDRMSLCTEEYFTSRFQQRCLSIIGSKINSLYDIDSHPFVTGKKETLNFRQKMSIAVTFKSKHLRRSATFSFLRQCLVKSGYFLRLGGARILEDANSPQLRSKAFSSRFSSYSNFDVWLMAQGRFISVLFQHLGDVVNPTQTEYNLLQMLCLLMSTKIDDIRSSTLLSQNLKLLLIERETTKLHRVQASLLSLGSIRTVVRVLGRQSMSTNPDYTWKYAALLLRLGGENMSWENKQAQNMLVTTVLKSVEHRKPPECNCMIGLQDIIRKCSLGIISSVTGNGEKEEEQQLNILRASVQIFTFAGALCKGDNNRAQRFLSADGATSKSLVNISEALCMLVHSIIVRLTEMFSYISNDQFYEKLAPLVYAQKDSAKRRFLEWHNPRNNLYLFAQFVYTISIAFEECISLCSQDSVNEILQALPKTDALLEFLGLLQLKVVVNLPGSSVLPFQRKIEWRGGDPIHFYRVYLKEMTSHGLLKPSDVEYAEITSITRMWHQKARGRIGLGRESGAVFGISYRLMSEIVRKAEYSCLRLLLSSLEFTDDQQAVDLLSRFNDGILIQNMDSLFHRLRLARGDEKDQLVSTTVAYVSLIESIGIYHRNTDELLTLWDKEMLEKGIRPKSIYGSVELVGVDRRLRRLYFPVPSFANTYWSYPEVQKLKDEIVLQVNRNSPEEKIADFLAQIGRISIVMKRQERLKLLLTYPIHAIFGGKSIGLIQGYFPRQRAVGLYIAMLLNVWFVRLNTAPFRPMPHRPDYLDYHHWDTEDMVIYLVQLSHLLLMGSFALRTLLNSDAADEMPALFTSENTVMQVLGAIVQFPVVFCMMLWDSAWPCVLTALSFFALTGYYWLYVPCLLDIVFQFDDMNFLYVAISRNVVRVGFTCLLAFLCLYFYAILAYLFFGTQYSFDGYEGCDDPGACFKLHLDYGLSNAPTWNGRGYIAPTIDAEFPYSRQFAGVIGTIYNLTYVILINLVLQAVISGLIIDTFSSMRAEKEAVQEDIHGKCFICSIDRDTFEQAGVSYNMHIKEEHNMWHYAWFKIYLDLKDPLSYSSIENYAIRCMKDKQTFVRMMPINKSLTLEKLHGQTTKEDEVNEAALLTQILRKMQLSDHKVSKLLSSLVRSQRSILESLESEGSSP